ncbi:hypothetical protein ARALYDRAFT_900901 [Arabidopsis lyrata subsp. lyrata]|uniref:KIB1-4 beta-propeller domain-containing protein n=1 Tax=Arabidopsis lyrata subsp. lyrata TaxID=81972 RepID=D7LGR0_ARALL|nr:hypothetical protein ARALYDRAFT_900901 [Arabidopsis lyrata subsp. lyrata]
MEGQDRPAAVAAKRSGSPKYNECAKALRPPLVGSPLLLLSQEEGGCCLYKPEEDKFYETKSDFSRYRFLASSGKWFLVVDSRSDLYIIDVFSDERIRLPPLESINGGLYMVERVGSNEFKVTLIRADKNGDFVVVWQFEDGQFLGFCKKGDLHYRDIPIRVDVRREFRGLKDVVRQKGHQDRIAVTTSGEVLLVFTKAYEPFCERSRIFRVYKRDPKELDPNTYDTRLVEMESIGDEALFFDLGITVPADLTLGIEPTPSISPVMTVSVTRTFAFHA